MKLYNAWDLLQNNTGVEGGKGFKGDTIGNEMSVV